MMTMKIMMMTMKIMMIKTIILLMKGLLKCLRGRHPHLRTWRAVWNWRTRRACGPRVPPPPQMAYAHTDPRGKPRASSERVVVVVRVVG